MGAALELLTAILVLVGSAQNGNDLTIGGQGDGAGHAGAGALCGLHDLLCCGIDQLSIIALQTDSDFLFDCHCLRLLKNLIFALGEPINCSTQFRVFGDLALEKPVNRSSQFSRKLISKSNPNIGSPR